MAAVDSAGFPTRPASNELVEAAWGSAVRDRLVVKAGWSHWDDGNSLGAAIVDLFTVTIPTQTMATSLFIHTSWMAKSQGAGGGTAVADNYLIAPLFATPSVGPWDLPASGTSWSGASQQWVGTIAANQSPSYKVRFTGAGGPGLYRVYCQSTYLLVVT